MDEPSSDFSWMYNFFQQGNYAIRRSDRFGQGFGELAIWKSLMRNVKSRGGLPEVEEWKSQ